MALTGEVQVRLSGDNSQYKNMLSDSTKETESFAAKVTDKVADKIFGLRDISTAIATALGLNFQEIADKVARVITGISKAEEEGYKSMAQLSDQATEIALRNMRAKLTEEQKYQLALQERDSLQRKVDAGASEGGADQARLAKLNLELQQKSSEVIGFELKQRDELAKQEEKRAKDFDESVKKRLDANEKQVKADIDLLQGAEKLDAMLENYDELEAQITEEKKRGRDVTQMETILAERSRDIGKEIATQDKKAADEREKAAEKHIQNMDKIDELKFNELTTSEKIAKLEESRAQLTDAIEKGKRKGADVSEQEVKLLEVIAQLGDLRVTKAQEDLTEEEKITAELEKQAKIAKAIVDAQTRKVKNVYGAADKDLSDRELAEKAGNLKKQLQGALIANDSGAFFFQQKLAEVNFEIGRRESFRSDYAKKGEKAFLDFSAFDEQTLRNYIRPEDERRAQQDSDALQDIRDRLSGAKPAFGIGG